MNKLRWNILGALLNMLAFMFAADQESLWRCLLHGFLLFVHSFVISHLVHDGEDS